MDKKKKAVALSYNSTDLAPKVIAKGEGDIAKKITDIGKDNNVKIHQNENIVNNLMKIKIGQEIPEELYEVIAEIIAFVYKIDKEKGDSCEK